ncbi:cytochrome P450 9e2 [Leptinotarsa decemlineata]|uniref:cytochrome P450 9e2 n=1 Tax=Leptinotarsa decemlineata TaxID=7539 RepID=UPI003D308A2D
MVVTFGCFCYCFVKRILYWQWLGVRQTFPIYISGNNREFQIEKQNYSDLIIRSYNQCQDARYIGVCQFSKPTLMIRDPKLIELVTIKDSGKFRNHQCSIPEVDSLWAMGCPFSTDEDRSHMRSILTPFFTNNSLKIMFRVMSETSENFVNHFLNKNQDLIELEMFDTVTRYVNDVMATSVFGTEVDSLKKPDNEMYFMGRKATDSTGILRKIKLYCYSTLPTIFKFLEMSLISREVTRFFDRMIGNVIRERFVNRNIRYDMIQLAMEAIEKNERTEEESFEKVTIGDITNSKMTYHDIAAQLMTILFAGYNSTSAALCFTSHELAVNPDIQKKLRKEIEETLEECGGNLTYESLMKMKYLDMIVSESLRKWPSTIASYRRCTNPYTILPEKADEGLLRIRNDTQILIPIFGIHRDPAYYPDPDCFDPERFSDENKTNSVPFTYMPFGNGPRDCVGSSYALLTIKLLLFHLLTHYELVTVEKTSIPLKLSKKSCITPTAEGGFWLGLKRIQK